MRLLSFPSIAERITTAGGGQVESLGPRYGGVPPTVPPASQPRRGSIFANNLRGGAMAARAAHNHEDAGSSPAPATIGKNAEGFVPRHDGAKVSAVARVGVACQLRIASADVLTGQPGETGNFSTFAGGVRTITRLHVCGWNRGRQPYLSPVSALYPAETRGFSESTITGAIHV